SIGYDAPESELTYARMAAEQFKTEHYEMRLTHTAFRDSLPNVVWHMDEPVADAPSVPFYFVSKFARSECTVALCGEGADEILAGYPMYNRMLLIDRLNRLPGSHLVGRCLERWAPDGKFKKHGAMLGRPLESRYRAGVIFSLEAVGRLLPDQ